jgi:DNA topoisomerase-3
MRLVIAEKPALARDIARALCGTDASFLPQSGGEYTVVACLGHMLGLIEPAEIDAAWANTASSGLDEAARLAALPIAPSPWPKKVAKGKEEATAKIAALLKRAECVIHAGDPDDEGQLIVDELLEYLGYAGPVKRVYINDSLDENIKRAFENLIDNDRCKGDGRAALARQVADFTFGINESRLASIRLRRNISIGRVQTPTLGLVVARDAAAGAHESREFYELVMDADIEGVGVVPLKLKMGAGKTGADKHLYDPTPLKEAASSLEGSVREAQSTVADEVENPPLPYNLTELQQDMNKRYKLPIDATQQITQVLRDKYRAITYNRTESRYLKGEHFTQAREVLGLALGNIKAILPLDFALRSGAFDGEGVSAHHAIIPQAIELDTARMSEDERRVYRAITLRYALQFLPPKVTSVSKTVVGSAYGELSCHARRVVTPGFSEFSGTEGKGA